MIVRWRLIALALLSASVPIYAQRPPTAALDRTPDSTGRAQLEGDIRRGFARLVRQRVGLTERQMRQLGPVARKHDQQRRDLLVRERQTRTELRNLLEKPKGSDSARVSSLLQTLIDIQKRRVELVELEQRDLAAFMTPVQRARYLALQEQIRRRLEQMRQRGVRQGQ